MKLEIKSSIKFGKLEVVKELQTLRLPSGQTNRVFLCKCDCGNDKEVRLLHLVRNRITSCGCSHKTRNGLGSTLLAKVWRQMKYRCSEREKSEVNRRNYYDKGIRVIGRFNDWNYFYEWSMANGYKKGLTIDRIDNSMGYSEVNCRWVTQKVNNNNREDTIRVEYNGITEPLQFILERLDKQIEYRTIYGRIKRGWNPQKAIDTPLRKGNYRRTNTLKKS